MRAYYSSCWGLGFAALAARGSAITKRMLVCRRMRALHICALGALLVLALGPPPAAAQFVCDSDAAGESGAGANAAGGSGNVACGTNADASGNLGSNTATGAEANASGTGSLNMASGFQTNASGASSVNSATGRLANASGDLSANIASGNQTNASGNSSSNIATGFLTNASGANSSNIAIGTSANASGAGTSNTAVGANSIATGGNASAFGTGASATFANSAAFGNGATATRASQQVFGTGANTYTMGGITSAASRAAQTGPLQVVTSDASGNLATQSAAAAGIASTEDISAINSRLDALNSRTSKAITGVAMAFAMAGVPTLTGEENFAVTMNWGTFEGAHGTAISAALRLAENVQLNAGFGYGIDERIVGGRAGLRFAW